MVHSLSFALILVAIMCNGVASQSNICRNIILSMSSCLNYNSSGVINSCCTKLDSVIASEPQCLCQVQSYGGSNFGMGQVVQALANACRVQIPSFSDCPRVMQTRPPAFGILSDASTVKLGCYHIVLCIFFIGLSAAIFGMA